MKINALLPTILLVIFLIIAAAMLFLLHKPDQPLINTSTTLPATTPDFNKLFLETVDCAALMAATESVTTGELSPGSNVFNLVGYTLGMAQDYALKANREIKEAKARYDNKTIHYYLQLSNASATELAKNQVLFEQCVATARHYDPATMIDAAINDAKKE